MNFTAGRARKGQVIAIAALVAAAVLSYFTVDVPAVRFAQAHWEAAPAFVQSFFDGARFYGQGFSVVMVFALIMTLEKRRRAQGWRLAVAVIATMFAASLLKGLLSRARPNWFLGGNPMWLSFKGFGNSNNYVSMPSAHAASAFVFATCLARIMPRGRWIFYTAAALCGISRVMDLQHFPSDVLAGAAVGLAIGWMVFSEKRSTEPPEADTQMD